MNKQEAQFILSSYRRGGQDANDPHFREALALAKADPEMARWFAEEIALDTEVARKLSSISVPPDLRSNILAGRKLVRPEGLWRRRGWLAWAACFLLFVAGIAFWSQRPVERNFASFQQDMSEFLTSMDRLDFQSANMDEIRGWLARDGAHGNFTLPDGLADVPGLGCRVLKWHGKTVTLICFKSGSEEVHLLVVDRSALRDAPGEGRPEFGRSGTWSIASWSHQEKVYLLTAQGGRESLEKFL
jgi:hypothetical protein